jgi:hypothetical protein
MSGDYYCTLDKEEPHWTCKPGRKYGHTYHSSLESCQKECNRITMVSSLIAIITGVAIGAIGTLAFSFRSYRFHNHNNDEDNDEDTEDELLELWHVWDRITQLPLFSGAGHRRFIRAINARKDSENILAYINFLVKNNPNVKSNIDKIMEKSPHDIAHWANRKIDEIEKMGKMGKHSIVLRAGNSVGRVANGNPEKVLAFKSKKPKSTKRKSTKRKSTKRKSTKRKSIKRNSKKTKSIKRKTKKSKRKNKKSSKKSRKVRKSH